MPSSISEDNGLKLLTDKDMLVYSVGISTGGSAEMRMAKLNPKRRIIATTLDSEGVKFARKHIDARKLAQQIEIKLENVSEKLCYENHFFDFVYARLVLHYLPKNALSQALKELNRILKPGGRLFVVVRSVNCFDAKGTFDPATGLTTFCYEGQSYQRYFHTEASIQEHLKEAGFSIGSVKSYEEQLYIDFQRTIPSSRKDSLIEVIALL